MRWLAAIASVTVLAVALWLLSPPPGLPTLTAVVNSEPLINRGKYLVTVSGCASCHTDVGNNGAYLAGGLKLETEFGDFITPNITPDAITGIGQWGFGDFARAMRFGVGPDQRPYYPSFPYTSYTQITLADLQAMFAYLQSVTPVARENQAHDLHWYVMRGAMRLWQKLFFTPGVFAASPDRSPSWNRGAYIADALTHCSECHTPRNQFGVLRPALYLAGNENGPHGEPVPDITASKSTGIGEWDADELSLYLAEGELPDGDYAGGAMVDVIDNSTSMLTSSDMDALVDYLLSVPPANNHQGAVLIK